MKNTHAKIKRRFQNALDALQSQSSAATGMLDQKLAQKPQDRAPLKSTHQRIKECEPEVGMIWRFVMSGDAGKNIPDLTIKDLEPLIYSASANGNPNEVAIREALRVTSSDYTNERLTEIDWFRLKAWCKLHELSGIASKYAPPKGAAFAEVDAAIDKVRRECGAGDRPLGARSVDVLKGMPKPWPALAVAPRPPSLAKIIRMARAERSASKKP